MNSALLSRLRSPWLWLALGFAAVYIRGLFLDVMDVDASQYASISMEMLQNGHWLQVQHRGADYLDKPPMLFWLSTSSFWLFGLSNWAYKLPSLLAAWAGIWATYKFTSRFYGPDSGRNAAFILASCMGLIVICNDVRTDTILLGFTACAVWQLAEYVTFKRWLNLIAGFFFVGLAMLAKGPIGLVMPAFAVGSHLLMTRDWRGIFQWKWLLGLLITTIILLPMCWGLWQQFDLHPEKLVNERHGVSGLWFYFWEQSFGRITGENVWKNDTPGYYFMHVYLWAFLPWCLFLPVALWRRIRDLTTFKKLSNLESGVKSAGMTQSHPRTTTNPEFYALGGFLLTFIALSQSQYKLPHYIFITLPWAAVLVASAWATAGKGLWRILYFATGAALLIAFAALFFVFPGNWWAAGIALVATAVWLRGIFRDPFPDNFNLLVQRGLCAALIFGFVLNFHFYANLLPYQSTPQAARFARSKGIPSEKMYFFEAGSHAMEFYNGVIQKNLESTEKVQSTARDQNGIWVFTSQGGKTHLENARIKFEEEAAFRHFQVALLKPKFLNPATREQSLATNFLLKILPE